MNKDQRELALCAALRHYTYQACHGLGSGGVLRYTRAEAQNAFCLTTAAVAHAQAE